jgi:hypothetical protein
MAIRHLKYILLTELGLILSFVGSIMVYERILQNVQRQCKCRHLKKLKKLTCKGTLRQAGLSEAQDLLHPTQGRGEGGELNQREG